MFPRSPWAPLPLQLGAALHGPGTDIDTLSFGFLMDAVESVKSDTELFRDVFAFNPYCEEIIARFEKAEADVHALLEKP